MSIEKVEAFFRELEPDGAPGADRASNRQGDSRAPGLLDQRRPQLSHARPLGDHALRRGVPAHSPGDADRQRAGRRALHPRRAVDRSPPARQRPAAGDAEDATRLGNTLIVIEHDEDTMRNADVVVDIGPGAGAEGGEILTVGTLDEVVRNPRSETGAYLSGRKFIPIPKRRREPRGWLEVRKATVNNLPAWTWVFRSAFFARVTGVSGSGKSTLVNQVLVRALNQHLHGQPAGGTYGT